jgi:hypothetical protein
MQIDPELSPNSIKKAPADRSRARKRGVLWSDVLRAVQDDESRSYALTRYRASGHSPDDFANLRAAREAMLEVLTYTEDWLEMLERDHVAKRAVRKAIREGIREVRRRLELELWP